MTLKLTLPNFCKNELAYVVDVVFTDFLELDYEVKFENTDSINITNPSNSGTIRIDCSFFRLGETSWLEPDSLPELPLRHWVDTGGLLKQGILPAEIPVLFGDPDILIANNSIRIQFDIFGTIFFLLSRYEEMVVQARDRHDRFSAIESIAYKGGFLDRPLADEYIEILCGCICHLWKDLTRPAVSSKSFITCDLDFPFDPALQRFPNMLKRLVRHWLIDRKFWKGMNLVFRYLARKIGVNVKDEYRDTIDWIMDVNESAGNRVGFYFIADKTSKLDCVNNFSSKETRSLLREIYHRGHILGVHPGYNSYNDEAKLEKSINIFKKILSEEGVFEQEIGERQHYLRWDCTTPALQDAAGMKYDSTLAFADMAGFRCGTSRSYPMYDLQSRMRISLVQIPLISMEATILSPHYEGLGYSKAALDRFIYFKNLAMRYGGTYTLLWHNSHLLTQADRDFYLELISDEKAPV